MRKAIHVLIKPHFNSRKLNLLACSRFEVWYLVWVERHYILIIAWGEADYILNVMELSDSRITQYTTWNRCFASATYIVHVDQYTKKMLKPKRLFQTYKSLFPLFTSKFNFILNVPIMLYDHPNLVRLSVVFFFSHRILGIHMTVRNYMA
jgi:hypothetical protein